MEEQTNFNKELSNAVHAYLEKQKHGRFATPIVWVKAIALITMFFVLYGLTLFGPFGWPTRFFLAVVWGFTSLLIVFNIGHDAVHGSFSPQQWVNKLLGYSFNLVGANAYSWQLKHNEAHHVYTNIDGKDHDVEMDPFLRVSPHKPYRWYFRWQHVYWPFIYAMFSLLIIFVVDILIFFQEKKSNQRFAQPLREWGILIFTKLFYLFYIFWIPVYYVGFSWHEVFIAFFTFHFINGIVIGLVFQPSHYFEGSEFYKDGDAASIRHWNLHQLLSTVDISPDNRLLSHALGSLNANVSHHLYPKICHVHYPYLSTIIKNISQKYQIPYHRKSYKEALKSHSRLLKQLSRPNST